MGNRRGRGARVTPPNPSIWFFVLDIKEGILHFQSFSPAFSPPPPVPHICSSCPPTFFPKSREMAKGKTGHGQTCGQSSAQTIAAKGQKKKAAADGGKKRAPGKMMGKWFPSATHDHDLETLVAEKSLPAALRCRLPG